MTQHKGSHCKITIGGKTLAGGSWSLSKVPPSDPVGAALIAAVIADPDDDTPRLAYADWLEENGQHDRAEFIRVQVALARLFVRPLARVLLDARGPARLDARRVAGTLAGDPSGVVRGATVDWDAEWVNADSFNAGSVRGVGVVGEVGVDRHGLTVVIVPVEKERQDADRQTRSELRRRERELLANVARSDFGDRHTVRDAGVSVYLDTPLGGKNPQRGTIVVTYRRGFVHAVTCTAADWDEHAPALVWPPTVECGACKGNGCGKPTYSPPKEKQCLDCRVNLQLRPHGGNPDFERWCPRCWRVVSGRHEGWEPCPSCGGKGRVPNPDPPAATCQPVREVTWSPAPTRAEMNEVYRRWSKRFPARPYVGRLFSELCRDIWAVEVTWDGIADDFTSTAAPASS